MEMDPSETSAATGSEASETVTRKPVDLERVFEDLEQFKQNMEDNSRRMEEKIVEETTKKMKDNSRRMEENSRDIRHEIRNVRETIEKTGQEIETLRRELQEKIVASKEEMSRETDEELEKQKQETMEIVKNLQELVMQNTQDNRQEIVEIRGDLEPMKEKIARLENRTTERIQVVMNPGLFTMGDMDLKFYGDKRTHPVIFLRNLNEKVNEMPDTEGFKKLVRSSLKSAAESWFDLVEERCKTMNDFNDLFPSYYWGSQRQAKVRENLYKFQETFGSSREEYVMRKISAARYLEPKMADEDIIKYLGGHLPMEISDVIAIQGIVTVERLLEYLRRIDYLKPVRRNGLYGNNQVGDRKEDGTPQHRTNWRDRRQNNERVRDNKERYDGNRENTFTGNNEQKEKDRKSNKYNNGYRRTQEWNNRAKEQEGKRYAKYIKMQEENGKRENGEPNTGRDKNQRRQNLETITVEIEPTPRRQDFC